MTGQVCWEDTGSPVEGLTLGLVGVESRTDEQGRFTLNLTNEKAEAITLGTSCRLDIG
jgi:hypothetical protein